MNKRQSKKNFRKYVHVFPSGSRTKAGAYKKKRDKEIHKWLIETNYD